MEVKKLNLNQPFLSVRTRRPSSQGVATITTSLADDDERRGQTVPIPCYKSELKSGPVGKKGAVPFHWEQTPGNPREESTSETKLLPPGRYDCNNCEYCEPVKEKIEEKMSPETEEDGKNNIYDDDDEDEEVYEDALDRLSQTNSSFFNCSLSGVSGLGDSDSKNTCGNFSRDPNTLNLVMDRFLPAAKAMASETPQFLAKKAVPSRKEPIQEVKKIAVKNESKPSLRYGPSFANRHLNYCYYYNAGQETGEEEEQSSDDDNGALMPQICGLFPRFCFKGSPGILNTFPGLSSASKYRGNRASIRNDFEPNSCDVAQVDKIGESALKTFGEFLEDKEAEDRAVDIENTHLVECSKSSSSTVEDDKEIGLKESKICVKKLSEYVNISPPLPKSPSDSWLGRTLPSVNSKNAYHNRHSNGVNGKTNTKAPISVSRWEAIVKLSKLQNYSNSNHPEQDLLTPLQKT